MTEPSSVGPPGMSASPVPGATSSASGADSTERTRDISNTVAFTFLDEMSKTGKIAAGAADVYKSQYKKLHDVTVQCLSNEKQLLHKAKELSTILEQERLKLEQKIQISHETQGEIDVLQKESDEMNALLNDVQNKIDMTFHELDELETTKKESEVRLEDKYTRRLSELVPAVTRLQAYIDELKVDIKKQQDLREKEEESTRSYMSKIAELAKKIADHEKTKLVKRGVYSKVMSEPDRIRSLVTSLDQSLKKMENELQTFRNKETDIEADVRRLEEETGKTNNEIMKRQAWEEQNEEELNKHSAELEEQRTKEQMELMTGQQIQLKVKMLQQEVVHKKELGHKYLETYNEYSKLADRTQKDCDKYKRKTDTIKAIVPPLTAASKLAQKQYEELVRDVEEKKAILKEMKDDEELFIAQFLNKEKLEKETKKRLEAIKQDRADMEENIKAEDLQEKRLMQKISELSGQRELMARAANKAANDYKESKEDLKIKNLILIDLDKQTLETYQRLKMANMKYEKMKNSRNRFQSMYQNSLQTLAELREKSKILNAESETLRQESTAIDRALAEEIRMHLNLQNARDAARVDHNKLTVMYRQRRAEEKQQMNEIKKLNAIVNETEMQMIKLRSLYADGVDTRNLTGIQLIDRNDELCILYEKANIQESIFKSGETEMSNREADLKGVKLEISELRRKIELTLGRIPSLAIYERAYKELQRLEQELKAERALTYQLCEKLENPTSLEAAGGDGGNGAGDAETPGPAGGKADAASKEANKMGVNLSGNRCRQLKGVDPESEQLAAKIEVLQDRLNDKKEQLLEKDLVLDEVSSLSDKLRMQAAETRGSTLELAKKVNDYQGRIRDITRKMMAAISELSMYQATAMKLQHQKGEQETELRTARERMETGLAPTEDSEYEWFRRERDRMRRQEALVDRANKEKAAQANAAKAAQGQLVKTTAVARPNHYLPEELALPKPYGQMGPFKPTVPGASMRHIRKPVLKEIEL